MAQPEDLASWLRLLRTPGIGRGHARALLAACGSAQAVVDAAPATRRALLDAPLAEALARGPTDHAQYLATTEEWLAADAARHVLVLGDPHYPAALLETADPPLLLYAQGRLSWLAAPALAVVGSRNPTPQGSDNARSFASHLSRAGLTVVSGLALGIDGAAHDGALDGASATIAVVGTGLDRIYPSRHRALAHRIAAAGLLLSEFDLGTPPLRENFPQRNRILAGLGRGTLIVEAALQSGSLITARFAAEAGREVFAIPGSIHSPQSRGCHALIKQGAKLVECVDDILHELRWTADAATPTAASAPPATGDAAAVLDALGHDPVTLDALLARTGLPTAVLTARLLELELDGRLSRLPGGLFQRRGNA